MECKMTYEDLLKLLNSIDPNSITDAQKRFLKINKDSSKEELYEGLLVALKFVHRVCKNDYNTYKINRTIVKLDFNSLEEAYKESGLFNPYVRFTISKGQISHSIKKDFSLLDYNSCYNYKLIETLNHSNEKIELVHGKKYVLANPQLKIKEGCYNIVMLRCTDNKSVVTYYDLVENPKKSIDLNTITCQTTRSNYVNQCP